MKDLSFQGLLDFSDNQELKKSQQSRQEIEEQDQDIRTPQSILIQNEDIDQEVQYFSLNQVSGQSSIHKNSEQVQKTPPQINVTEKEQQNMITQNWNQEINEMQRAIKMLQEQIATLNVAFHDQTPKFHQKEFKQEVLFEQAVDDSKQELVTLNPLNQNFFNQSQEKNSDWYGTFSKNNQEVFGKKIKEDLSDYLKDFVQTKMKFIVKELEDYMLQQVKVQKQQINEYILNAANDKFIQFEEQLQKIGTLYSKSNQNQSIQNQRDQQTLQNQKTSTESKQEKTNVDPKKTKLLARRFQDILQQKSWTEESEDLFTESSF